MLVKELSSTELNQNIAVQLSQFLGVDGQYGSNSVFFSRNELLIESEARSPEFLSDVAPNARAAQADANLNQGLYIYICTRYWTRIIGLLVVSLPLLCFSPLQ